MNVALETGRGWWSHLRVLILAWMVLLAAFHRDVIHLVSLWLNSSTFNHCLLLLPVIGWLIWLRRHELALLTPRAWTPGLLWMAGGSMVWIVGDAASVAMLRQIGLVVMVQGTVPALLGPQVTRGLLFPLGYSFFLIPFGEELVPPMQMLTADMAMAMLRLFGIPAYIDGIFITTPYGYFAVAEACSGVKFLVAMAALAVLAAHLCFKTMWRRLLFLAFAMIVPILANGVRAFSTILIAEYWGTDFAASADHVIYGWFFFGIVIALIGWAAYPWFDRDPEDVMIDGRRLAGFWPGKDHGLAVLAPVALVLVLAPLAVDRISAARAQPLPVMAVDLGPPGWQLVEGEATDWRPRFDGADMLSCRRFARSPDGPVVDRCMAGFVRQGEGRELVGFGQGALDPDSDWRWGRNLPAIGSGQAVRMVAGTQVRDTLTVYMIDGTVTSRPAKVKWLTLKARLTGGDERAYALVLSAQPATGDGAQDRIARFVGDSGGLETMVARLTAQR